MDISLMPYRSIGIIVLSLVAIGRSWVAPNISDILGP